MNTSHPFSLSISFPSGQADGIRVIERSGWDGLGVFCPRPLFKESKQQLNLDKPGIYLLLGPSDEDGVLHKIYIGEGDPILNRLNAHGSKRDARMEFWDVLVAFTSSRSGGLNKAHVQYLEARLLEIAKEAKRCELVNEKPENQPTLSMSDRIVGDGFLNGLLQCLPVLGVNAFEKAPGPLATQTIFSISAKSIQASGYESTQGFVVRKGSKVVQVETNSIHNYLKAIRKSLRDRSIVLNEGSEWVFAMDFPFDSPSTAAGVVLGRSANGRTEWKDKYGNSLRDIQESE